MVQDHNPFFKLPSIGETQYASITKINFDTCSEIYLRIASLASSFNPTLLAAAIGIHI